MSHIDTLRLALEIAAQVGDVARRADHVRKEPAVRKAARKAADDVAVAGRSIVELAHETSTAWRRSANGPAVASVPVRC